MASTEEILKGALYVVATPIGNLADLSSRAHQVLTGVDVIAAEDTRHTRRLLDHYAIHTPCMALHDQNERRVSAQLVARLTRGDAVALVSDAGTPLVSDPGFHLVRAAQAAGIRVVPLPGPSALIAALCASGLATDRFVFEGFLPSKARARRERLCALVDEPRTLAFFEAPHRILSTLRTMVEVFGGEREGVIARELTKVFETVRRESLRALLTWLEADPQRQRGEFVILVEGAYGPAVQRPRLDARQVVSLLAADLPPARAAAVASKLTGVEKSVLYRWAVAGDGGPQGGDLGP